MHECPAWLAFTLDNPMRRFVHRPERLLAPYISEGQRVADIGCGSGVFTLPMAKYVGPTGRVWAVDVQSAMLAKVERAAKRQGLAARITLHQCESTSLGLSQPLDFFLLFFMLHEAPDPGGLLGEVADLLNPAGKVLLIEPPLHVTAREFAHELDLARKAGLEKVAGPEVWMCHTALFSKTS